MMAERTTKESQSDGSSGIPLYDMADEPQEGGPPQENADALEASPLYEVADFRGTKHPDEYSTVAAATMNRDNIYTEAVATNNTRGGGGGAVGKDKKHVALVAVLVGVLILVLLFIICFVAVFLETSTKDSQLSIVMVHLQQINASLSSIKERLGALEATGDTQNSKIQQLNISLYEQIQHAFQQIHTNFSTRLELHDTIQSREVQQLNTSINTISEQFTQYYNGVSGISAFHPATSCAALPPSSPSGYYWVTRASNGSAVRVYCDMTRSCGGITGGWMRVAELDMTNSSQQCLPGLREHTESSKRTCVKDSAGCSSVTISTATVQYSRVCGRIIGYQVGHPDTFNSGSDSIDSHYVDGVSLTHGFQPRQHIWTFAAGLDEVSSMPAANCPCTNINTSSMATQPPGFVGNNYFCDTGSSGTVNNTYYFDDPLWDGTGCGPLNTCCSFNNPPWFYRQLPQPTTNDIELRSCSNGGLVDSAAIETLAVYIQ